jgi:CTP:molybdopterin cytidylyltransferase MocA
MKIVSALLAAGASARFGRPKQLVHFGGEPLVRRAIAATVLAEIAGSAVVLGANGEEVARALDERVVQLTNELWAEGIASSIRTAVRWAEGLDADAIIVLLADQPLIDSTHTARLIAAWPGTAGAAASEYDGVLGAPAIFGRELFDRLLALSGDCGAGRMLRTLEDVASVPCPKAAIDIDTPIDLETLAYGRLVG